MITSTPSGANLYINDESVGTTPYTYSDTKIVGTTTKIRIEKEGYETCDTKFSRNECVDVGAIVAGAFVYVPLLWIMKYKPEHNYELNRLSGNGEVIIEEQTNDKNSSAIRLRELKKMYKEQLITKEEYDAARTKILK